MVTRKRLSVNDDDGISAADQAKEDKMAKKVIPRSHLAEIIDEFEVDGKDIDDDVSEDIITDTDDLDDDR